MFGMLVTAVEFMGLADFHVSTTGPSDFLDGCNIPTNCLSFVYGSDGSSCSVPTSYVPRSNSYLRFTLPLSLT